MVRSPGAGEARRSRWCPQAQRLSLNLRGCQLPASKQASSVTCSGAFKAAEAFATCEAWTRTTTTAAPATARILVFLMSSGREGGGRLRCVESPIPPNSTFMYCIIAKMGVTTLNLSALLILLSHTLGLMRIGLPVAACGAGVRGGGGAIHHVPAPRGAQAPTAARLCTGCCVPDAAVGRGPPHRARDTVSTHARAGGWRQGQGERKGASRTTASPVQLNCNQPMWLRGLSPETCVTCLYLHTYIPHSEAFFVL